MALGDEKYILFTTFKRDGTAVSTPTWVVRLDDGTLGFWTSSGSGKAKRLAHTSKVTVQPCDARGKVATGSTAVDAEAHLVTGAAHDEITAKVKTKYGFMTHVTKLLGTIGGFIKRKKIPYGDRGVVVTLPAEAGS
jgi:uncharacterized protein